MAYFMSIVEMASENPKDAVTRKAPGSNLCAKTYHD